MYLILNFKNKGKLVHGLNGLLASITKMDCIGLVYIFTYSTTKRENKSQTLILLQIYMEN